MKIHTRPRVESADKKKKKQKITVLVLEHLEVIRRTSVSHFVSFSFAGKTGKQRGRIASHIFPTSSDKCSSGDHEAKETSGVEHLER